MRLAEEKRRRKKSPLLIANRAQDALGSDANEVTLLDDAGEYRMPKMDELALARRLVGEIAKRPSNNGWETCLNINASLRLCFDVCAPR